MAKNILLSMLFFSFFSFQAAAVTLGDLGIIGPHRVDKVATVLKFDRQSPVTLEGYLVKDLGQGQYVFRDRSGEIGVEISSQVNPNIRASSNSLFQLVGTLDHQGDQDNTKIVQVSKINLVPSIVP